MVIIFVKSPLTPKYSSLSILINTVFTAKFNTTVNTCVTIDIAEFIIEFSVLDLCFMSSLLIYIIPKFN